MNKKGQMSIVFFFIILLVVLVLGFVAAISVGLISWTSAQVTPVLQGIGNVDGAANVSEAVDYSVVPANNFIQALPWLVGFTYVIMLIFSIFFVVVQTKSPHPIFLVLYVILTILLIFFSIIMSNMYQDIYTGTDVVATQLQSQTLMSYMILRSPFILTLIALISGIFMFALQGANSEGGLV